jgi:hypothetical protein
MAKGAEIGFMDVTSKKTVPDDVLDGEQNRILFRK